MMFDPSKFQDGQFVQEPMVVWQRFVCRAEVGWLSCSGYVGGGRVLPLLRSGEREVTRMACQQWLKTG